MIKMSKVTTMFCLNYFIIISQARKFVFYNMLHVSLKNKWLQNLFKYKQVSS